MPGVNPCSASTSAQTVGVACPLTAVITWATFSVFAAGELGAMP